MLDRALPALAVLTLAASAAAVPVPLEIVHQRGMAKDFRRPLRAHELGLLKPLAAVGQTDVKAIRTDVTLDPVTGVVGVKLEIDLQAAASPVSAFGFYVDSGLQISAASANSGTVTHSASPYPPYSVVSLGIDPPIAVGTMRTISVDYGGQLACTDMEGNKNCAFGTEMPFLLEGSVMPALIDAFGIGGYNVWGASRSLTLRLPSGIDVVASGELAESTDDGTTKVTRWETPAYQSIGGYLAVMGDFSENPATGTSVPTIVHGLASSPLWSPEMASWMQPILAFVDDQAGAELPYMALNVIKIPGGSSFPGTAGHAITLLSEDYATPGPRYFEETLAHENAHQWWGVLVSPTDTMVSRWLTEGLATMAQVDYTAAQRIAADQRDTYLAWRYREHRVLTRYHTNYESFPPLVVPQPSAAPNGQPDWTIWAYIRSAAVLESFRAAVGDDVFATALRDYGKKCKMASCDTSNFRVALEAASGLSFEAVFSAWVYETHYPRPTVTFSQEPVAEGQRVVVQFSDEGVTTPLELLVLLEDGTVQRQKVMLAPGATTHELTTSQRVRSIRPNPRHDAAVWSRSAQPGDLDFDREVDGFDLIQCARALGKTSAFTGSAGDGILGIDLDFDPRCDTDESGTIDDQDLEPTLSAFGVVKEDG